MYWQEGRDLAYMKYRNGVIEAESSFLSAMDRRVYRSTKSKGDEIVKSNIIKKSIAKTLGCTIEEIDEEGNLVEVSIAQKLVNATIVNAIENPDTRKLKEIANIMGELKETGASANVYITSPSEMFKGIGFDEQVEVIEAKYKEI